MAGITKLDDGLKKLDKMTNEEARMANAEVMRIAHSIEKKVTGVDKRVRDVDDTVKLVEEKVQMIINGAPAMHCKFSTPSLTFNILDGKGAATEAKLIMRQTGYKVDEVKRSSSVLSCHSRVTNTDTGRQLRESLRKWQSPSDPSTNHNIACNRQHGGTTEWFCKGNKFEKWKATGSLLWIHGKRMLFLLWMASEI